MSLSFSADRWRTLERLLDAIVDVPPERRRAFVEDACGADVSLRADLSNLLSDYERADPLLDRPAAETFASLLDDALPRLPRMLLGRYRIDRELGSGGMATVYLAHDVRHDRQVAVKVLRPEIASALGAERFLAEIRLTARLQHPHILPLHDSGDADGLLFYVMPYVAGESLRRRLEREGQLPLDEVNRIIGDIASALEHAHARGVVHRDIKPENILFHDGTVLVADFGIALALGAGAPRVTRPGIAVGTPQYMSPEQGTGDGVVDSRSDVYALGTVLYEMLTGEPPFTGASATAIIAKRSAMPAPSARVVRAAIPASVDAVVARALAREPVDRYATAGELAEALAEALGHADAPNVPALPDPQSSARRAARVLGAVAGVLLVAAGMMWIARSRAEPALGSPRADDRPSLAVLPFKAGNDSANAYVADAMTDDLSSSLGSVPGIRLVPGRSAAFLTRRKDPDFVDLGRRLGVSMLLAGSVRVEGPRLRVAVYLIDAHDGSSRWTQNYSREIHEANDNYAVRDSIVADIVRELRLTLNGNRRVASRRPTEDLEALNLYNQGRYFFDQRYREKLGTALPFFQQAVARDSNFAEAYSGIADVYSSFGIGNVGDYRPNEYFPLARSAAERAVALDPESGAAHASLGIVHLLYDFDWTSAERELATAIALEPGSTQARVFHAVLLEFTGRFDEAIAEAQEAVRRDPLSNFANIEAARAVFFGRRYDSAYEQARRTLERDSTFYRAHLLLGQVFEQQRKYDSAVAHMEASVRFAPNSSRTHAYLAHAYAKAGRTSDALAELAVLDKRARTGYVPAFDFAVAYVGLGRNDETFVWLDKSIEDHSLRPYLMDGSFDGIRTDPRYQPFLRRLNIPVATRPR